MNGGSTTTSATTSGPRTRRIASFAASKFLAPSTSGRHVSRPVLSERLDAGEDALRLVVGSPGSGKTSLLAEWYHGLTGDRAWVSVDESDRDATRFWTAFIAAVHGRRPGFGAECMDLLRLDARVDHAFLECLLASIGDLDASVTIAIDDFHLAGSEVESHVRFLLGRGIAPLRLAIGTRTEPDIGLQRLRLEGRLCELREPDLRFDEAGAVELLDGLGVRLPAESLDVVMHRTEGWAAGLQLAALALRDAEEPGEAVERLTGTNQVIAHYLWSEVYAAQPSDVQRFLLDTCVVDELSPPLAAALSPGNPVSLLDIEAANLLFQRVDPDGTAFRYHHLLRDLLRFRLRATDDERESVLHERAARWYGARGDPVLAFRHLWRAGLRTEALRSMHGTVLDVVYDSLTPTMVAVERSLTDDDIRAAPAPALSFALALLVDELAVEADRLARRVHALVGQDLTEDEALQLDAVRAASMLVLGDTHAAIGFGRGLVPGAADTRPWASVTAGSVARAHVWEGNLELADRWLMNLLPAIPTVRERVEVASTTAQLQLMAGDLSACLATATAVIAEVDRMGRDALRDNLLARAVLGAAMLDRGELRDAERVLQAVSDSGSRFRVPAVVLAGVALSRLWASEGNPDAALVVVDDAYQLILARPARSGLVDRVREQHARVLIASGSLDAARSLVGDIGLERRRRLVAAELALASADPERADHELGLLDAAKPVSLREQLEVAIGWLRVDLAACRAPTDRAATVLDLAAQEGFILPLVEAGADALAAVQRQARRRARTPYLDEVMRLRPRPSAGPDRGVLITPLTERERAVLRYLPTAMSYGEIAADLAVSLNTIKTHVKNINQKLDVHSREAAVDRALELHYLS